jgi:hypothetical protein
MTAKKTISAIQTAHFRSQMAVFSLNIQIKNTSKRSYNDMTRELVRAFCKIVEILPQVSSFAIEELCHSCREILRHYLNQAVTVGKGMGHNSTIPLWGDSSAVQSSRLIIGQTWVRIPVAPFLKDYTST